MRTTVRLPDSLMRQIKRLAVETDRTLTQVIEDSLREALARARGAGSTEEPFRGESRLRRLQRGAGDRVGL